MAERDPIRPGVLDFKHERERLMTPFVQRSSGAAREAVESLGDLQTYFAQFPRDEARVLRMIVGDLLRSS